MYRSTVACSSLNRGALAAGRLATGAPAAKQSGMAPRTGGGRQQHSKDIAISEDPGFRLFFKGRRDGQLRAESIDSQGMGWSQAFKVGG